MKKRTTRLLSALLICVGILPTAMAAEPEVTTPPPDPAGVLSWENLDSRVREGSLTIQLLSEQISGIESINYEAMRVNLRDQLNGLAEAEYYLSFINNAQSVVLASEMNQAQASVRDVYNEIVLGDMQKDNADIVRHLEDASNQVVYGAQSMYIALLSMDQSLQDANRGLAALDRMLDEIRLRQSLGQVSLQTVAELEQTRASTASQIESLKTTIAAYKSQLQVMIGEEATGELTLLPLPSADSLIPPDLTYEAALAQAKQHSWTLYEAAKTLDDAKEQWKDDRMVGPGSYRYATMQHSWEAAQITYQNTVTSYETDFLKLYDSLSDYRQIVTTKQSAYAHQQQQYAIAEKKYALGTISRSALQTEQDNLAAVKSELTAAELNLFSALNQYQAAVKFGILN